jgi:Protein of unknown function (DUF2795)
VNRAKKEHTNNSHKLKNQRGKIIRQRNGISGQGKEVNVESYSGVANLAELLKDVYFPSPKSEILDYVIQSEDFSDKDRIVNVLSNLKDRTYNGVADLTTSAGLVHRI